MSLNETKTRLNETKTSLNETKTSLKKETKNKIPNFVKESNIE